MSQADPPRARSGGVQSIERVFGLLETMADNGGMMGLSQLSAASGLPLPTIHRLVRTLVGLGYLRQEASRQYVLGPKLIRLGESSSQMLGVWARAHLTGLVDELGETANLAMLDGDQIVYVAQVPSRHSMRMFTEVGRRFLPHSTAVGKAILAYRPDHEVADLLGRTGMPRHTEYTLTTPRDFLAELATIRDRGYAIDESEQELGVRCVAVVVPDAPQPMALSMSGPLTRMSDDVVERAAPVLQAAAAEIADELNRTRVSALD